MSEPRLRVGVYVNDGQATTLRLVRCLQQWGMSYRTVWRDELIDLPELGIDVLLLHGGWYGIDRIPGQEQYTCERTPECQQRGDAVRAWVAGGGGVVGVCAGAFNVVWLGLIEADISRMTGMGPHALEVIQPEHPLAAGLLTIAKNHAHRTWKSLPVVRLNGPIFFPKDPTAMVFSYDWEQRLGAVLAAGYQGGRAVALSPHPERPAGDVGMDDIPMIPLDQAALLLKNSLQWAAGRG